MNGAVAEISPRIRGRSPLRFAGVPMFLIRTVFWLVVLTLVVPAGASGADPGANGTGGLPAIGSNDPAARAMTAPAYR